MFEILARSHFTCSVYLNISKNYLLLLPPPATISIRTDAPATALALARPTSALVGMLGTHWIFFSSCSARLEYASHIEDA